MFNFYKLGLAALVAATITVSGCGGGGNGPSAAKTQTRIVVFSSDKDSDTPGDRDIYRVNSDGNGIRRLTNNSPINDFGAELSPDGREIVYVSAGRPDDGPSGAQIYLMNSDGSDIRQLTNRPGFNSAPSWSSDGRKILFTSLPNGKSEIYVMNSDGSGQVNLTSGEDDIEPVFNGDNSKIVFSSRRGINDPTGRSSPRLNIMNADGSNIMLFPLDGESAPVNQYAIQFSPDGRKLLISGNPGFGGGGPGGLFVANADGTGLKQISTSFRNALWNSDSQSVYYISSINNDRVEFSTIKADGTDVR